MKYKMVNRFSAATVFFILTVFAACKKDFRDIEISLEAAPMFINIQKSYVFEAGTDGFQYAYGTVTNLKEDLFVTAVRYPRILSDFEEKAEIIAVRSKDGGVVWGEPSVIQRNIGVKNTTNPSVIEISRSELIMTFSAINSEFSIDLYCKRSINAGEDWTDHKPISETGRGYHVAINDRLVLNKGRLFLPVAFVDGDIFENYERQEIVLFSSDNLGETWKRSNVINADHSLMEPNIVCLDDQEFLMNMRTKKGYVYFARSKDGGITWKMENSNIPSPASPQKIVKIPGTDLLVMVWNNTRENFRSSFNNRSPLSIAVSDDKGYHWRYITDIETNRDFDYSYPSIAFTSNEMLVLYYEREKITNNKASLKLAKVPLNSLKKYKDAGKTIKK